MTNKIFVTLSFNKKIDDIDIFINNFKKINYDRDNIYLFIVSPYYKVYNKFNEYKNVIYFEKIYKSIFDESIKYFLNLDYDYYLYIDSSIIFQNYEILNNLIKLKHDLCTPLLYLENTSISNVNITDNINEICIRDKNKMNSIYKLNNIIFIKNHILNQLKYPYIKDLISKINNNTYQYIVTNNKINKNIGYIKESNNINIYSDNKINHELFDMSDIKLWEKKYLHHEFKDFLNGGQISICEPIPYLFEFPLFNERFCNELIEIMEETNKWSDGGNNDKRLSNGYENVPTVDTHFNQIGFEKQWNKIVFNYIAKIAEKGFVGSHTSRINMSFVVKYTSSGQNKLRPHNDSSLYSAMVALNKRGTDFEGGGTRFIRHDYKHLTQKPGYCVIFPGRLTHYHEGLETTKGTRYIIVSFIE